MLIVPKSPHHDYWEGYKAGEETHNGVLYYRIRMKATYGPFWANRLYLFPADRCEERADWTPR